MFIFCYNQSILNKHKLGENIYYKGFFVAHNKNIVFIDWEISTKVIIRCTKVV